MKFQIKELREYCNHLDEMIARYKKQGRDPSRLQDNKAKARETIEQLKQAQNSNSTPLQRLR
jgi:hypothetical protein